MKTATPTDAQNSLWREHLARLLVDDAYHLTVDGLSAEQLHGTADAAKNAAIGKDGTGIARPAVFAAFADSSVDVVMRGGTASGVVYPLALCAIAEKFRLRSVGGSSAGAIGAAMAAAAELGRRRMNVPNPENSGNSENTGPDAPSTFETGQVRQGFAGLADLTAWLTEMTTEGPPSTGAERYRLAAVFKPVKQAHAAFRVAAAFLRDRPVRAFLLLPFAAKWWVSTAFLVAIAIGVTVTAMAAAPDGTSLPPRGLLAAALAMIAVTLLTTGAVLVVLAIQTHAEGKRTAARRRAAPPGSFIGVVCTPPRSQDKTSRVPGLWWRGSLLVALAVGVEVVAWFVAPGGAADRWTLVLAAFGAAAFSLVVNVTGYAVDFGTRFVNEAQAGRYGLISGGATGTPDPFGVRLDRWAGASTPGSDDTEPLVPWLSDLFNRLSGRPDEVLRFGHLWLDTFTPGSAPEYEAAAVDTKLRLVNLELMASDITNGVAYRFPLHHVARHHSPGIVGFQEVALKHASLYFSPADFSRRDAEVFGKDVIDALCDTTSESKALVPTDGDGEEEITVRRLPDPWNLPVVFAVRLSLSLPFLFQAVPLYREVPDRGEGLRVERVWFSDGGLTSNFPIHFFDEMLPPWPTLGINLTGVQATSDPKKDLPRLYQSPARSRTVGKSLVDFFAAIFATSRNWRDNMHILLPGFGMRVFNVQLGPGEGDTNIFMKRDVMASLALRGVEAGIELRDRFARSGPGARAWRQHQSVRLQTTALSIARTLKLWNDDAPEVGLLAEVVEGGPGGTSSLVSESSALMDDVFAADVVATWKAARAGTAELWPPEAPENRLADLAGAAGRLAADARGLQALTQSASHERLIRRTASFAESVAIVAADLADPATVALAAGAGDVDQALQLATVTTGTLTADLADFVPTFDDTATNRAALVALLAPAARDLDIAAGPLAALGPAASARRLSRTWDRHGVMESRPSPRT